MKITERFQIEAPSDKVWEFISNPEKMGSCLPAVESIEVVDDRHFKALVKQRVGFISATFEIYTEILERVPPSRLVLSNKGKSVRGAEGSLGSVDTITVTPVDTELTEVSVESDLKLGGKLAVLGAKLIEAKARDMVIEVTKNLRSKVLAASEAPRDTAVGPGPSRPG